MKSPKTASLSSWTTGIAGLVALLLEHDLPLTDGDEPQRSVADIQGIGADRNVGPLLCACSET